MRHSITACGAYFRYRGRFHSTPQAFQETQCVSFQDSFAVISSAKRISSEAEASQKRYRKIKFIIKVGHIILGVTYVVCPMFLSVDNTQAQQFYILITFLSFDNKRVKLGIFHFDLHSDSLAAKLSKTLFEIAGSVERVSEKSARIVSLDFFSALVAELNTEIAKGGGCKIYRHFFAFKGKGLGQYRTAFEIR